MTNATNEKSQAWQSGVLAGLSADTECPYESGTESEQDWWEGYNSAQTAMRDTNRELAGLVDE